MERPIIPASVSLTTGSRLGPYEVLARLGAGGMGEVYRTRDGRLKRDMAIKVLPTSYSADQDRLRRFEQEAQAAGSLNHPIAALLVVTALAREGLAPRAFFQPAAGPLRFTRLTSLDPAVPMFA
jgi:hypothetical protein